MKNISKLAIDIGHNVNFDGGAVGIKREDILNYAVGTKLIEKCRAAGVNVINCTPSTASSLNNSLNQRIVAANTNKAEFFISIHHNLSSGGEGSEIYSMKGGKGEVVANNPNISAVYHTVVKGDTLWGLSRKYGVTLDSIVALNGVGLQVLLWLGRGLGYDSSGIFNTYLSINYIQL